MIHTFNKFGLCYVDMLLEEAYTQSKEDEDVKSLIESGGYLCSAYVFLTPEDEDINSWELGFHKPDENEIVPISVNGGVEINEGDEPLKEEVYKISIGGIDFTSKDALEKAKKIQEDNFGRKIQKILLSIKKEGELFWNVALITGSFSIISVKINVENGEVIDTNEKSLMQNMGSDKKLNI